MGLRELPKNEFPKNSTNTSNDVFQPLLSQQPNTNSTIPVFLSNMPLNVDGLDEVASVKTHVRLLLRELPKNEFPKNSTNTSNDVFQPLLLQQPNTNSTIPVFL